MSNVIRVHGGPWHGKTLSIPDKRDHFHVVAPVIAAQPATDPDAAVEYPTHEGMYSRVGNTDNFEWDGWLSHD